MSLSFARAFTAPKDDQTPNEDCFGCSADGTKCAVSDGASVSFDPAPWAKFLVEGFLAGDPLSREKIASVAKSYGGLYDRDGMDWMQQGSFDRGAFASLLGVKIVDSGVRLEVTCVGDSLLAILDGGLLRATLPYQAASSFDASPQLISTNPAENAPLFELSDPIATVPLELAELGAPAVLLMTDALGHWLLSFPERGRELLLIDSGEQFARFVAQEREAGFMRRDDTTLLVIEGRK